MRANIHIRQENEEAWKESGKSRWINQLLADGRGHDSAFFQEHQAKKASQDWVCKNGHYAPNGRCNQKGCKYA